MATKGPARNTGELSVRGDREPTCYRRSMPSRVNEVVTQLLTRLGAMKRCGDEPSRLVGQAEREQHVHVALDGRRCVGRSRMRSPISARCISWRSMRQALGWCSKSKSWETKRTNSRLSVNS